MALIELNDEIYYNNGYQLKLESISLIQKFLKICE